MKIRITLLVILLCLYPIACLAAPLTEGAIAIFPGSIRDDAMGASLPVSNGEINLMAKSGLLLERISFTVKSYFTNASAEEVTAFY